MKQTAKDPTCNMMTEDYSPTMQGHSEHGRRRHRHSRNYKSLLGMAFLVVLILAFVAFIMYALTSPDWRTRW
jgi:hypothetical protein